MNLRQLETFFWGAKLGSFVGASNRLRSTQSTVSMRIQELERELGVVLFERNQRSLRLTSKGRVLLPLAEQMIQLEAEIRSVILASEAFSGTLRIGVAEVISVTWLPRLIKTMRETYPKISIEMEEALTLPLIDELRAGALDLVLAPGLHIENTFRSRHLGTMEFYWMASPSLPLPAGPITPRDMTAWPIITLSPQSHHRRSIDEWFQSGGVAFKRFDTCKSLNVAASLAAAGLGITFLPKRCYDKELKNGTLRIIETKPLMSGVLFSATTHIDGTQPLAEMAAALAADISDFEQKSPS
ncbi:LysR family transcriptional regulator [Bradyrhizobium erythrophlei]|uniref:Transcriptional regulator, LysR family n=1 Tax=Bradyrhizobium erythrophlei TaxID=1437360 RepID=A0A1M5K2E9_9BRAD|nr:LysR family transcriptional regulator [Bradyrhizobium erythrophlei]SHG46740.1 transcriptional regulator, LysR family [Bradyrhizobium erythrophlei]